MMAAGLAIGVGIGFVVINSRTVAEPSATAAASTTGLAYDDFIRLNTAALDGLVPAVSAAVIETPVVVDPFIYLNTTALDGLVPSASAAATAVVDPNFLYWNTEAFKNLAPTTSANGQTSGTVSEEFLEWNITSLEYPARYSEQSSGPR